jgi:hypothetical protein
MTGYPWAGTTDYVTQPGFNNASVLEFWFNLSMNFPRKSHLFFQNEQLHKMFTVDADDKSVSLFADASNVFVTDGYGLGDNHRPYNVSFGAEDGIDFTIQIANSLEDDLIGHWSHMVYDPNIGILFSGSDPSVPTAPGDSSKKIGALPSGAVVGIVVGCVALLILVIVLLVIFVPSCRLLVRPFVARQHRKSAETSSNRASSSTASGSGWQRGSVVRAP